jgi:hypothetical protein
MAILTLGLHIPDMKVIRADPCGAITAPELKCGATPASLYLRICGVPGHERRIWLCITHVLVASCGAAICQECASRGGVSPVSLFRLSEPLRFT